MTVLSDSKISLMPLVNIDADNYMLRDVGRPASLIPLRAEDLAASRDTLGAEGIVNLMEEPFTEIPSENTNNTTVDNDFFYGLNLEPPSTTTTPSTDGCARVFSFHDYFCSCSSSCCCKCDICCSPECHSCFHNFCTRYHINYICQKDNTTLPPVTLNYDKVSFYFYYLFLTNINNLNREIKLSTLVIRTILTISPSVVIDR